jgi:hypothetical protein
MRSGYQIDRHARDDLQRVRVELDDCAGPISDRPSQTRRRRASLLRLNSAGFLQSASEYWISSNSLPVVRIEQGCAVWAFEAETGRERGF